MAVRGAELKRAVDAFIDAFPRPSKLEQLLEYRLEKNLDAIAPPGTIGDRIFELFRVANSEGWEIDLVDAARASNPRHRGLLAVAQGLGLAPSLPAQLEAWVDSRNQIHDGARWYQRLGEAFARVCRIELDDRPRGTGFLVGPDLVLTNQHVVAPAHARIVARFDYRSTAGRGVSEGLALRVINVIDQSPPSLHDGEPDAEVEPTGDELDYALLRLERALGNEPIGARAEPAAPSRGWFAPSHTPLAAGSALFIVQHPQGSPISLAFDTRGILGTNRSGTRVRYRTNTEPGSSGSPCFDQDWNLIALHHLGDAAWLAARFNQGIPIAMIAARLVRTKSLALSGPEG
jgi:hypothetical protein